MKRSLLVWLFTLCLLVGLLPPAALAAEPDAAFEMPVIGFKVRMNERGGGQPESLYTQSGSTLEVELARYTSAYIRPYIKGVDPNNSPWSEHTYYTFTFSNVKDEEAHDEEKPFGEEAIYNRANTGNQGKTSTIVVDSLDDERLGSSYYKIIVKAYKSGIWGDRNPSQDTLLGTAESLLYVKMSWNPVLDWIDSYVWDKYYIENNLEIIYDTSEALIEDYLKDYNSTEGCDQGEFLFLEQIPVTWAVKDGTVYSVEPGASNTFTWTADPKQATGGKDWRVPEGFPLSGDVIFYNPVSVTFLADEMIVGEKRIKRGGNLLQNEFPVVPWKEGYRGVWESGDIVDLEENLIVTAVYTPCSYPITYVLDDGVNAPENPDHYTVEDTIRLKYPTKDGYAFEGWTYSGQETPQKDLTIPAGTMGPLTLTAHWTKDSGGGGGGTTARYTLHYESNGGTEYDSERYTRNTEVRLEKVPVREGYTFTGWYADKDLTEKISTIKMTSNKTVYAGWEATGVPDWLNGADHFAYIIGDDEGYVRPLANVTRAETAAIFFRLLKEDVREEYLTDRSGFADVEQGAWYNKAVSTMAALGVVKGYTEDTFAPHEAITRAEFAAICARFDTGTSDGESSFTDISGHWAESEIRRAAQLGWIQGDPDGRFRPNAPITRAEAMTIINRVLNRLPEEKEDLLAGMKEWPDALPGAWYYLAVQEATNSHAYEGKGEVYERWTALNVNPDWTEYQ